MEKHQRLYALQMMDIFKPTEEDLIHRAITQIFQRIRDEGNDLHKIGEKISKDLPSKFNKTISDIDSQRIKLIGNHNDEVNDIKVIFRIKN